LVFIVLLVKMDCFKDDNNYIEMLPLLLRSIAYFG
jgi:hypothetical protein